MRSRVALKDLATSLGFDFMGNDTSEEKSKEGTRGGGRPWG